MAEAKFCRAIAKIDVMSLSAWGVGFINEHPQTNLAKHPLKTNGLSKQRIYSPIATALTSGKKIHLLFCLHSSWQWSDVYGKIMTWGKILGERDLRPILTVYSRVNWLEKGWWVRTLFRLIRLWYIVSPGGWFSVLIEAGVSCLASGIVTLKVLKL